MESRLRFLGTAPLGSGSVMLIPSRQFTASSKGTLPQRYQGGKLYPQIHHRGTERAERFIRDAATDGAFYERNYLLRSIRFSVGGSRRRAVVILGVRRLPYFTAYA